MKNCKRPLWYLSALSLVFTSTFVWNTPAIGMYESEGEESEIESDYDEEILQNIPLKVKDLLKVIPINLMLKALKHSTEARYGSDVLVFPETSSALLNKLSTQLRSKVFEHVTLFPFPEELDEFLSKLPADLRIELFESILGCGFPGAHTSNRSVDFLATLPDKLQTQVVKAISRATLNGLPDELKLKILAELAQDPHERREESDKKAANESLKALCRMAQTSYGWRGMILKEQKLGTLLRAHGIEALTRKLADTTDKEGVIQLHQRFTHLCGWHKKKNPFENGNLCFFPLYTKLPDESIPFLQDLIKGFYELIVKKIPQMQKDDQAEVLNEISLSLFLPLILTWPFAEDVVRTAGNNNGFLREEILFQIARSVPLTFLDKLLQPRRSFWCRGESSVQTEGGLVFDSGSDVKEDVRYPAVLRGLLQNPKVPYANIKATVLEYVSYCQHMDMIFALSSAKGLDQEGFKVCFGQAKKALMGNTPEKSQGMDICSLLISNRDLNVKQLAQVCDLAMTYLEDDSLENVQKTKFYLYLAENPRAKEVLEGRVHFPGAVDSLEGIRTYTLQRMIGKTVDKRMFQKLSDFLKKQRIRLSELPKSTVKASPADLPFLACFKGMITRLELTEFDQDIDLEHLREIPLIHLNLSAETFRWSRKSVLTDSGLAYLPKMLISLNLSSCTRIIGTGLKYLADMPLKELILSGCHNLTDVGLQYLPKDLEKLDLEHCGKITSSGLKSLAENCKKLIELNLRYTDITDEDLKYLPRNLKKLTLSDCTKITDAGIKELEQLDQLTSLDVKGCLKVTSRGVEQLRSKVPGIQVSYVDREYILDHQKSWAGLEVSPSELPPLLEYAEVITDLTLRSPKEDEITDSTLELIKSFHALTNLTLTISIPHGYKISIANSSLQYLPKDLKKLELIFCYKITGDGLRHLPSGITELSLWGCEDISDTGLEYLPKGLVTLDLSNTNITDAGLHCLPKSLKTLKLSETNITPAGIKYLLENSPNLTELNLKSCKKISDNDIYAIVEKCPGFTAVVETYERKIKRS